MQLNRNRNKVSGRHSNKRRNFSKNELKCISMDSDPWFKLRIIPIQIPIRPTFLRLNPIDVSLSRCSTPPAPNHGGSLQNRGYHEVGVVLLCLFRRVSTEISSRNSSTLRFRFLLAESSLPIIKQSHDRFAGRHLSKERKRVLISINTTLEIRTSRITRQKVPYYVIAKFKANQTFLTRRNITSPKKKIRRIHSEDWTG